MQFACAAMVQSLTEHRQILDCVKPVTVIAAETVLRDHLRVQAASFNA